MARDESNDVGVLIEPGSWRVSRWNLVKNSHRRWVRCVPHDQLEAAERERDSANVSLSCVTKDYEPLRAWAQGMSDKGSARPGLTVAQIALDRIAELEAELTAAKHGPPRCKDGCEHWGDHMRDGDVYCKNNLALQCAERDGSSFCSYHMRLKK